MTEEEAGDGWEAAVARAHRVLHELLINAPLPRPRRPEPVEEGPRRRGRPRLDALGELWRRRIAAAVAQAAHAAAPAAAWAARNRSMAPPPRPGESTIWSRAGDWSGLDAVEEALRRIRTERTAAGRDYAGADGRALPTPSAAVVRRRYDRSHQPIIRDGPDPQAPPPALIGGDPTDEAAEAARAAIRGAIGPADFK